MSSLFGKQAEKGSDGTVTAPPASAAASAPRAPEPVTRSDGAAPADGRAHLDRGTRVEGKLAFDGPVWIDGEVNGEIAAKDSVTIGEAAVITAGIRAASVVVAGKVSGNINAANRIELRPSARVECDLAAPVVVIQEGAQFEGRCSMRSEGAERKIAILPQSEHRAAADKAGVGAARVAAS